MKLNKRDLLRLIYEQDTDEIDVSSIMPKEEDKFGEEYYNEKGEFIFDLDIEPSKKYEIKGDRVGLASSSIFSNEKVDLIDEEHIDIDKQDYLDDTSLDATISAELEGILNNVSLGYADVLAGNLDYLDYLALNPKEFLFKRIGWKFNKIVGWKGINRGRYKNFYDAEKLNCLVKINPDVGDFFVDLSKSKKSEVFIDLCKEYYGDDLKLTSDNNTYFDLVLCMLKYSNDVDKVLYAMCRTHSADRKFNRQDLSVTLRYLFDLIQSDLEVYSNEFPSLSSLYLRLIELIGNTENYTNTYLVDNDYKIRLEFIECHKKVKNCFKLFKEFYIKQLSLSEEDFNSWKVYALKKLDNYDGEFVSDTEFNFKVSNISDTYSEKCRKLQNNLVKKI